jgi:hypothetical protein
LDGSPIRAKDLFDALEKLEPKIGKTTALPALKRAIQEKVVLESSALVDGQPAKFYRLAVEPRFFGQNIPALLGLEAQWPQLFQEGAKGCRTRADLERFLKEQLNLLLAILSYRILDARAAKSQEEAKYHTELLLDYVIRRWASRLAEVMWVTRDRSGEPFLKALRNVRLISRRTETVRIEGDEEPQNRGHSIAPAGVQSPRSVKKPAARVKRAKRRG